MTPEHEEYQRQLQLEEAKRRQDKEESRRAKFFVNILFGLFGLGLLSVPIQLLRSGKLFESIGMFILGVIFGLWGIGLLRAAWREIGKDIN